MESKTTVQLQSKPWFTCSLESSTCGSPHEHVSTHTKQRRTLYCCYRPCRSPFEKSQILPVRNVIPCKVEMAPPGGGHILCETACQPNAGCGRGGQGPKPAGRCAQRSPEALARTRHYQPA